MNTNYLLTYLLTHSLNPWNRVLLEKLTGLQIVKKFPAFYGTRRFITAFKCPPPVPIMSQLNSVHIPTSHFLKIHLNTILPSTPGSPHLSLSPRFPYQNPLHASPLPHTRYMPRPPHYSRFITRTVLGEEYRRISSSLCSFLHSAVTLGPNILLNTLFSKTLSLRSSLTVSDQSSEILIRGQIRSAHYRLPETEGTSLCSKI